MSLLSPQSKEIFAYCFSVCLFLVWFCFGFGLILETTNIPFDLKQLHGSQGR